METRADLDVENAGVGELRRHVLEQNARWRLKQRVKENSRTLRVNKLACFANCESFESKPVADRNRCDTNETDEKRDAHCRTLCAGEFLWCHVV